MFNNRNLPRFNNTFYYVLLFFLVLNFTSCVSVHTANLQRQSEKEVEIYATKIPSKEYAEIKYIQVEGSIFTTHEKLMKRLSQKAKKEGADAVINVQYAYIVYLPYVWGIAIKYK
jgi:hypothetical protein